MDSYTESERPDFTKFKPVDKKKAKKTKLNASNVRWWLADKDILAEAVMSQVKAIIQADRGRIDSTTHMQSFTEHGHQPSGTDISLANSGKPTAPMRDRLTYNIVQSCIDTLTARIAQNKPKPMFLTEAGNSKLQRKAKKLDQSAMASSTRTISMKKAPKIFRDACIYGEGILHSMHRRGTVKA
jgi:hypothetical protein